METVYHIRKRSDPEMIYKTGECDVTRVFMSGDTNTCLECGASYSIFSKECPKCHCPNPSPIITDAVVADDDGEIF